MNTKNNRASFSRSNYILWFSILGSFLFLSLLAGCSLEGDISAVKRKAGLYTIAFNANGATSSRAAAVMTARAGSAVTLPDSEGLHYPGYVFAGWNPDSSGAGSTYPAGAAYSGTRNVTLYAMWVKEGAPSSITGITITEQPIALTNVTQGSIAGTLEVKASDSEDRVLKYQWYSSTENGIVSISDATSASFAIPPSLTEGAYYFFCEISGTNGEEPVRSIMATVQVLTMPTLTTAHFTIGGDVKTYNGSPQGVTVSYDGEGIDDATAGIISILYTGRGGTVYPESADAPINAGTYDVIVSTSGGTVYAAFAKAVVGTLVISKAVGAAISGPPTLNSKIHNSITVNAVSISGTNPSEQVVEYAINITNIAPLSGWQAGLTFSGLAQSTAYYLFARTQENANYDTGAASASLIIKPNIVSTSGIALAWIPAGTFTMGSPIDEPGHPRNSFEGDETQHSVTLTSGFYMGVYQVTQEQYTVVMGANPSYFHGRSGREPAAEEIQGKRPVEQVSWYDALVFCNRLSVEEGLTPAYRMPGYSNSTNPTDWGTVPTDIDATWNAVEIVPDSTGYRLPTEAQWEYACRAGTTTAFNDGLTDDWADSAAVELLGWYNFNSQSMTHEVGKKAANAWGLYDMHGNVSEWCWDWYGGYKTIPSSDPIGASSNPNFARALRSRDWGSSAQNARSAYRASARASYRINDGSGGRYGIIGFRLSRP